MDLDELNGLIIRLDKELPKKILDGKEVFDFEDAKVIPVVICNVFYNGKILIAKRSEKVSISQGKWSVVAGHLDRLVPVQEIILEELKEEVNIKENEIRTINATEIIEIFQKNSEKKIVVLLAWIYLKCLPEVKLNWENTEYAWVNENELLEYELGSELKPIIPKIIKEFENKLY